MRISALNDCLTLAVYLDGNWTQRNNEREVCIAAGLRENHGIGALTGDLDALPKLAEGLIAANIAAEPLPELLTAIRNRIEALRIHHKHIESVLPLGMELFPFQFRGAEFLANTERGLLADQMGLGKTVQTLSAIPRGAAVQVVAPVSLLYTWKREVERWRPDLEPMVQRKAFGVTHRQVSIAPYTGLPSIPDEDILEESNEPDEYDYIAPPGAILVFDEAHFAKNPKATRTQRSIALADAAEWGAIWCLTGTPILNRPTELWALLSLLGRETEVFGTYKRFRQLFAHMSYRTDSGFKKEQWGDPDPVVKDLLRPVMIHRKRRDVLPELPEKTYEIETLNAQDISVSVTSMLDEAMLSVELSNIFEEDEDGSPRFTAQAMAQVARARKALAAAKIGRMLEIVEQYEDDDEPLVVFCAHRLPIETLEKREGWAVIYGGMQPEVKQDIVEKFQRGCYKGIGCTIKAAGLGLTLTYASHCLMVDSGWTPAENDQAEDRVCRIGQTRGVVIKCLVAEHPIDELVWEKLFLKKRIIEQTIVHQKERDTSLLTQLETLEPMIAQAVATLERERKHG